MLLKEDYFKDLDLTDEDVRNSVGDFNTDDIYYDTPAEYYDAMASRYTHCIIFEVDSNNSLTQSKIWTVKIPHTFKNILYMFDVYGIEYSQPTVVEKSAWWLLKDKYNECNFIDFYEYKLITRWSNSLEQFIQSPCGEFGRVDMVLFFNLPKLHSYITACRFVGNIMRHLWKDENSYITDIMINNINNILTEEHSDVDIDNPYRYTSYKIDKNAIVPDNIVVSIISLFFPEKTKVMIFNELNNDTQLQLKLYQCFPD